MQPRQTAAFWGPRAPGAALESLGQAPLPLPEGATCSHCAAAATRAGGSSWGAERLGAERGAVSP